MEDRFRIQLVGQELGKDDVNLLGSEASLADDRVLAELLRLLPLGTSPSPPRGILPSSSQQQGSPPAATTSSVVVPSGSADAKTIINPFRAVIGPISTALGKDAYRDIRSAISCGAAADMRQYIQHPAQATNPRWDLIYAIVDVEIDGTFVNRYVKTDATPATAQSISTTARTRVSLSYVSGTPGATPTRPTLPADSGSSYNIPLAYVLLPAGHTLTSSIPVGNIQECAPILSLAPAVGGRPVAPASCASSASGQAVTNELWTPASGRPKAFLPATMAGARTIFFPLQELTTPRTINLGDTAKIIDDTTDWRKRVFRVYTLANSDPFSWVPSSGGVTPSFGHSKIDNFAQSFVAESGSKSFLVSLVGPTMSMAAGSSIQVYVDQTDGKIKADIGATNPACNFFIWVEATGQFNNAF